MRSKKIVIPGKPKGKGRTPEETVDYEAQIRAAWFKQADGWCVREGGVGVIVMAYFPIPKTASKERKSGMASGRLPPLVKPGGENILRVVLDALNGHAWVDNKQVVDAGVQKLYAEEPRVEVVLYDVG